MPEAAAQQALSHVPTQGPDPFLSLSLGIPASKCRSHLLLARSVPQPSPVCLTGDPGKAVGEEGANDPRLL